VVPDQIQQRKGGFLATPPSLPSFIQASLAGFRRINSVEANTLTCDLYGVAIDDPWLAGDIGHCG